MIHYRFMERKQITEKKTLSFKDVNELVKHNRFSVTKDTKYKVRCIDGRYTSENLNPLARPGADAGVLMELIATNHEYHLGLTDKNIQEIVLSTVGGVKHLYFHTDTHSDGSVFGCGHIKQAIQDPQAYQLKKEHMDSVIDFLQNSIKKGANNVILEGEHEEGAVLVVKGSEWSVAPQGKAFIYHQTLDDLRRKQMIQLMIPYIDKALHIDEEYLYGIMTQVADNQRMKTIGCLASGLPLYEVCFGKNDEYAIQNINI